MSVAIHAFFAANPAVVEVAVGCMVLDKRGLFDDGFFRKQGFVYSIGVVLKVLY